MASEFTNPFTAAKVFVSHRCADHQYSDYIARELSKEFDVYYSCRGDMLISDPVVPHRELARSDIILFLASEASFQQTSISYAEMTISEILSCHRLSSLCMVQLESYSIPTEYASARFETFKWKTRRRDIIRIASALKERIALDFAFSRLSLEELDERPVFRVGETASGLADLLENYKEGRILKFSAPIQAYDMTQLIEKIESLGKRRIEQVVENLARIYLTEGSNIAKQNSVYLLGKLLKGQTDDPLRLSRRMPNYESAFLFRGYQIAMSFMADERLMVDYMHSLVEEPSREWAAQREVNKRFHLLYYNGIAGALSELRKSIKSLQPRNLLSLNVFTLGELSGSKQDLKLLEESRGALVTNGVSEAILNDAVKKIRSRQVR